MGEHSDNEKSAFKSDIMAGKTCFMAGATSGINQQIARRFAMAGANVFVISRSEDKVSATVEELRALGAKADGAAVDVRDYDKVAEAVQKCVSLYGKIDMVLAGQAGNFLAPAAGMSANAFKSVIDIDLLGSFNVFRASVEHLNRPGASLIAVTAPQATNPMPYQTHVCAAKAGVNMLVKSLAMEWGPSGIRVNAISPGPIDDTEGMRRLAGDPKIAARYKQALALRRWGSKDDIANAALFLCTPEGAYITGTIMEVDGGISLGDASSALPM
jgi:NAD(P)-dependent dehydrogenase (short-subunit alcohol dehydrogenase family)